MVWEKETEPFGERPNRVPWPPLLLVGAIIVGLILQKLLPLWWYDGDYEQFINFLGAMMVLAALYVDFLCMRALHRKETTILPHRAASSLVTNGPFRFSRNPIYVANVIVLLGLCLVFENLWLAIAAVIMVFALNKLAIEREEAHLAARFGPEWENYRKKVRRWV